MPKTTKGGTLRKSELPSTSQCSDAKGRRSAFIRGLSVAATGYADSCAVVALWVSNCSTRKE